jgi:hypothetical protein
MIQMKRMTVAALGALAIAGPAVAGGSMPTAAELLKTRKATIATLFNRYDGGILMLHPLTRDASPLFFTSLATPDAVLHGDNGAALFDAGYQPSCSFLERDAKGHLSVRTWDCATDARLALATKRLADTDQRVAGLQDEVSRQSDAGQAMRERVVVLERQLAETEAAIADTTAAMSALSDVVAQNERQTAAMSAAIAKWPELFQQFRTFAQALRKNLDVIATRYNTQLQQLQKLQVQLKASLVKIG